MGGDRSQGSPVLTPEQVLALRGISLDDYHFDVAVLCFRGQSASQQVIDTFSAGRIQPDIFYGSQACAGYVDGKQVVILPEVIWGGPVTAILLEELACLGVQVAVGFGAAGSLVSPEHVGEMLIADRALCSDGTSREYTDDPGVYPSADLLELVEALAVQEGTAPLTGTVHTTDALYQESPDRVRRWREAGASFVNLETSPFYAVAAHRGIRAIYLGLVSDYVGDAQGWQHGFWSRPNATDPLIVDLIGLLVQRVELSP
jgi:uridine phosphorylase